MLEKFGRSVEIFFKKGALITALLLSVFAFTGYADASPRNLLIPSGELLVEDRAAKKYLTFNHFFLLKDQETFFNLIYNSSFPYLENFHVREVRSQLALCAVITPRLLFLLSLQPILHSCPEEIQSHPLV